MPEISLFFGIRITIMIIILHISMLNMLAKRF